MDRYSTNLEDLEREVEIDFFRNGEEMKAIFILDGII